MSRKKIRTRFLVFVIFISILSVLVVSKDFLQRRLGKFTMVTQRLQPSKAQSKSQSLIRLESQIQRYLDSLEVKASEITTQFFPESKIREIRVSIPKGKPVEWIVWFLSQSTNGTSYRVDDCIYFAQKRQLMISFTDKNLQKEKCILFISESNRYLSNSAKMAILVNNFNFEADRNTIEFLSFDQPLSFCLVPHGKKSILTAQAAREYKKELLITLCVESRRKIKNVPLSSLIMVHYPEKKIYDIVNNAEKAVPGFSGFVNLQTSFALKDSRLMRLVMTAISTSHGYFVARDIEQNPVMSALVQELKIPYASITSILENESQEAIENQLRHCAVIAQKKSKVVVLADAHQNFIRGLKEVQPLLKAEGIQLVYVSEIVNHPR